MKTLPVPSRETVSETNRGIFDALQGKIGFVPNLYAAFAHSETALSDYLALQNRKSTLRAKERETINLVVSELNGCRYCQSAHTALGKMSGFSEDQILELRSGKASFDPKLDALARLVRSAVENRSKPSQDSLEAFYAAGYDHASLVDVAMVIGDKVISNFLHGFGNFAIDWPLASELESAAL